MNSRTVQWIAGLALFTLLGATLFTYWPGLNGPLLLDDIPNLNRLKSLGPIDDKASLFQFIFAKSGVYPVRPLSFASFLINDTGWPLYIPMHKYTNVLIHLINGALVCWLSLLLCRLTKVQSGPAILVSLSTSALWLLAPLQVSTVLYVIQRMTELSALFVLCGLIAYCYGRQQLEDRPLFAFVHMTCGVGIFGLLGFLSKQNAVLMLLYILVAERTLLKVHLPVRVESTRRYFTAWKWLFLAVPVVLAFALMIGQGVLEQYDNRPFTAYERLLTQARILLDYAYNLLVPIRYGLGLAHDDYLVSTGLLSPPTTLLSIICLAGLLTAALILSRNRVSLFGFAVLWFLSGHLLESTIVPLELYWEHRNYLPAFGPLFAIAYCVFNAQRMFEFQASIARFLKIAIAIYVLAFAFVTKETVNVWSNKWLLGDLWAVEHPRSVRAQQILADYWSRLGYYGRAHEVLERISEMRPDSMGAQLQILLTACRNAPEEVPEHLSRVNARIDQTYFDNSVAPTLKYLTELQNDQCPQLSNNQLRDLIDRILANDSLESRPGATATLLILQASILSKDKSAQAVVSHLYAAFQNRPSYDIGMVAVDYLYRIGEYRLALQVLDQVSKLETKPWSPDRFRGGQLETWRNRIHEKLESGR